MRVCCNTVDLVNESINSCSLYLSTHFPLSGAAQDFPSCIFRHFLLTYLPPLHLCLFHALVILGQASSDSSMTPLGWHLLLSPSAFSSVIMLVSPSMISLSVPLFGCGIWEGLHSGTFSCVSSNQM